MWPGMVRALPVTEGTACVQRLSLLGLVVFLQAVVLDTLLGHVVSLCLRSAVVTHTVPVAQRCSRRCVPRWEAGMYRTCHPEPRSLRKHWALDAIGVCLCCQLR